MTKRAKGAKWGGRDVHVSPAPFSQARSAQQPQQIGVLFIITQQVQPDLLMVAMQSQQDWIISQHFWSPEVQVT